jgi:hypothetical protein
MSRVSVKNPRRRSRLSVEDVVDCRPTPPEPKPSVKSFVEAQTWAQWEM